MTKFLVTGLLAILATSIDAQEAIEIELEGKFVTKVRNIVLETDFKTSAKVEEHREKRETMGDDPPVVFNGALTIRSSREVRVIGVNVSFVVADIHLSEDLDLSRTKREAPNTKVRIGLHSQFRVGGIDSQSLGIRLNLDITKISSEYTPATSYDVMQGIPVGESRETFKFTGKVRHADENKKGFLIFAMKAGLTPKALIPEDQDVNEREKRGTENQIPEIKVDGEFIYEYRGYYGDRATETYGVTGEFFTFEQLTPADEATPRKKFFPHQPSDYPNVDEILVESEGNVTVSQNNHNIFQLPVYSGIYLTANSTSGREKRASATSNEVFEVAYNGFVTETWRSHPQISSQHVSANLSLWEISRIRN